MVHCKQLRWQTPTDSRMLETELRRTTGPRSKSCRDRGRRHHEDRRLAHS
jgi:hypothetical protein